MQGPGERAAVGRDEAHRHVRVRQVGRLRHVDDVRERDDAAAEAHGRSVDRGHHGDPAADHVEHELPTLRDHVASQRAVLHHPVEEIEVAAGRERAPFAGDDRDARVGVGAEQREDAGQPQVQLLVHGVELVRTGEPHDAHRAVGLDANHVGKGVVHGSPLRARARSGRRQAEDPRGDDVLLDLRGAAHHALGAAVQVDLQRRRRRRRSPRAIRPRRAPRPRPSARPTSSGACRSSHRDRGRGRRDARRACGGRAAAASPPARTPRRRLRAGRSGTRRDPRAPSPRGP